MKKTLAMLLCLVMLLSTMGAAAFAEGTYTPGTYVGEAEGMGRVIVTLTVDENGITGAQLDTSGETAAIGGAHDEEFIAQLMEKGAEIDGIAGASITSHAIRIAAGKDPRGRRHLQRQGPVLRRHEGDGACRHLRKQRHHRH